MKRYILVLLLLMVLSFIIQKWLITPLYPTSDFALMPTIPLFYIIYGLVSIKVVHSKPNTPVNVLLGVKMLKILLSLAILLLYIVFEGENSTSFMFSYVAYFVIYLVFETWMLSTMNKKTKFNND